MITTTLITVLPFILLGIVTILVGTSILFSSKSTSNWPTTEGTIVNSEVKIETHGSGDNTDIMKCFPQISYEYSVDDQNYTSSSVSEKSPSYDRLSAQEIVEAYKAGDKIEVFYNPTSPDTAVLETGSNTLGYFIICLGFLITLISMVKLILHFV